MLSTSQLLPAKLQTKHTLLSSSRTSSLDELRHTRTRTTSTSSIDTIRVSPKKKSSSKKRARASEESSSTTDTDHDLRDQDIRRTRQRKLSTDTVRVADIASAPAVAFPSLPDPPSEPSTAHPRKTKKPASERKVTPPKLNPGHAAPSVAVTPSPVTQASLESATSSPTAIRHAPPPPVRTRVSSIKNPPSRNTSPSNIPVPSLTYHRHQPRTYTYGFDPLPAYLQDWQPSCTPYAPSDDEEESVSDGDEKDESGRTPGISDLDLSISFHKKQPFFDVWDLPDDIYIAVPARLHLTLKHPQQWIDQEVQQPDLRYIDIRCNTFEYRSYCPKTPSLCVLHSPNHSPKYDVDIDSYYYSAPIPEYTPEYTVTYTGASSTEYADPSIVPADLTRGIIVNKRCNRYGFGSGKGGSHSKESLITNYGRLPDDSIDGANLDMESASHSHLDTTESTSKQTQGWFIKFMIPIPSWVLRQGNTRAFTVEASAWVGGLDKGGLIRGDTELVVSHLRSEREMVGGGWR